MLKKFAVRLSVIVLFMTTTTILSSRTPCEDSCYWGYYYDLREADLDYYDWRDSCYDSQCLAVGKAIHTNDMTIARLNYRSCTSKCAYPHLWS